MKKTLTIILLAACAVTSPAATIKWSVTGNNTYVINDVLGNPYANQKLYLIAASDVSSITDPTMPKSTFYENLENLTIATATSASDGTKPTGVTKQEVTSNLMTAGSSFTFGALIVSEDTENVYYKLFTVTATPYADDAPEASRNALVATSWAATTLDKGSWTKAAAVPEPSTAALALAGLALLLKRRKA